MKAEVGAALMPLLGLPIWSTGRAGDLVWFQIGERRTVPSSDGSPREVGTYAIHVSCPWRLINQDRLLVGSGDLLTPADPEAELKPSIGMSLVPTGWMYAWPRSGRGSRHRPLAFRA
jgi:hypothetical protein